MKRSMVGTIVCALAASLVAVPTTTAQAQTPAPVAAPAPFEVSLTSSGFVPALITVAPGQTIVIENASGTTREITSGADGTFASGPLAPASRFALAFPSVGRWVATDDASPDAHSATITVGRRQLDGDQSAPANSAIPDLDAPQAPVLIHPDLGIEVTRNRVLVTFLDTATVAQANSALAAVGLTIVGGNRDAQLLVTEAADAGTPGLEYMQAALDLLRVQPGVRVAAYEVSLDPDVALPRPANPDPFPVGGVPTYTWEAIPLLDETIRGYGNNAGLESARFPQAWNWLDAIRSREPSNRSSSATIVLDDGFDTSHPDIAKVTPLSLCTAGGRCTQNVPGFDVNDRPLSEHGTATAGVVGAEFDRGPSSSPNSVGTVGGDPESDVFGVPYLEDVSRDSTGTVSFYSFLAVLDLILDEKGKAPFEFSHLRVINLSAGIAFEDDPTGIPAFEALFGTQTCGPGDNDDATAAPAARVACTPNTRDSYLREFRAVAELARPLAGRLAANNVLLVVAAGNDSQKFCATRPRTDPTDDCAQYEPISAAAADVFGYLSSIWTGAAPPWVVVESNVADLDTLARADYSNTNGQLSADGSVIAPAVTQAGVDTYRRFEGTSMSAPLVTAAAGMLSSLTPSWATVRSLLVDRGAVDVPGSSTPRLDVFASLLGLPSGVGIEALLDVNDTSPDGNRRVVYDDRGQPTGQDTTLGSAQLRTTWAAPDGRIDMRDFRRYRDGWLDACSVSGLNGCPGSGEILLDGSPTHPKRDTNLDGCVVAEGVPQCSGDDAYSRVDFNGDGTLQPTAFPTLLRADGTPAARSAGTRMTDLDVFRTRFGQGPNADTEGWTSADLQDLLTSADIELRLDRLWAQGALSAEVTVGTVVRLGPRRTFTPRGQGDVRVYTMPIDPSPDLGNTDSLQVRIIAQLPGDEIALYLSDILPAKAGQDIVVTPCTDQLVVEATPAQATPGGLSTITARLNDCTGRPVPNASIDFEIIAGPNGSSISVVNAVTDAAGVARTVFSYPDGVNSAASVVALATPALDGGERLQQTVDLGPADDVVVHYRFRQTILDYERTSTNDWGAGEDDCDGPTDAGVSLSKCFVATQEIRTAYGIPGLSSFSVLPGELERTGTITPNSSGGATIDDSVRVVQRTPSIDPNAFDVSGVTVTTRVEEWDPGAPNDRVTTIYDSPIEISGQPSSLGFADLPALEVPTIDFAITDERLRVNNLRQFGDAYAVIQAAYTLQRGALILPETTNPDLPVPNLYQPLQQIPTDLALVPRSDSSSFAWDWNPDAPLEFAGNGDGTYQPTSWCGTRQRLFDNSSDPGFWNDSDPAIETTDPLDSGAIIPGPYRDPDEQRADREPGDRAAPRHDGSVTSLFEFVAVVTPSGAPAPTLEFPACEETEATPFFAWQPADPIEGQVVDFLDLSSYGDGGFGAVWRFDDPKGTSPSSNQHRFSDNGTYGVDFTVTDSSAVGHTSDTADVVVKNAPPVLDALEFLDDGRRIRFDVDDPGVIDRQQLEVRLTSPTPGWPSGGIVKYTAPHLDPMSGAPASGAWTETISLPTSLTPGVYFVVLTVRDKDGGTATRSFSLAVPVPPPPGPFGFRSAAPLAQPQMIVAEAATQTVPAQAAAIPTSPAPSEAVAASVIDRVAVATGELVAVRNATRAGGIAAAADLDAGDGRPPIRLAPGATIELAYVVAAAPTLTMRGLVGNAAAGLELSVTGNPVPATIAYDGATSAPLGADAVVRALVTQAGGVAVPGVAVRFTLGTESADAVTGTDGRASTVLRIAGATGVRNLVAQVRPDGVPIDVAFNVSDNAVPVVDAGGPYSIGVGSPLALVGSAVDLDPGEQDTLAYQWDLDADGQFDDAVGPEPSLDADRVRTTLCGGTCDAGEVATVSLRATDVKGGRAIDTATVTLLRDFALTINPASATLVPNANVSFTVSVLSANGFTGPVALTAPGLPAGITATFSPATVTPNGTSLLNIRAEENFDPANFSLVVRGTSGSIVRETGTSLQLEFGLIPQCFGAVSGRVTDETGAPVVGVGVFGALTNADGRYASTSLALEAGNAPRLVSISNLGSEFYTLSPPASVQTACGVPSTLDISVVRRKFGAVIGTITGIDIDGSPLGPINNATFALNRRTGPDGRYSFPSVTLGPANAPINFQVAASATGFHNASGTVEVSAGETETLDIALRKICTASVRVRVLDRATGRAVPGARVDTGAGSTVGGFTDSTGVIVLSGIGLGGPDNRPITRSIRAFTPTGVSPQGTASTNVVLGVCGAQVPLDVAISFPRRVEAPVNVLIIDDDGAPVPDAFVRIGSTTYSQFRTGSNGRVTFTHLLGIDVSATQTTTILPAATGWLSPPATPVTITEGQPLNITLTLVRPRFGAVEGTVRDRATGVPLAGVVVSGVTTGADGKYRRNGITLNGLNEPRATSVQALDPRTPRQYWNSASVPVTVRAEEVTQVPDLLMTRVCEPATIRGRVVNAVDRTPIEGARIVVGSLSDLTDADGRFVIEQIPAGTDNENLAYSVTASKSGFLTATKVATVSCAADIVVDFGRDGDGVGTISGRITGGDGTPVVQASVSTGFGGSARTNSNGEYTIANAPAGEGGVARDWTVRVQPPTGSVLEPASAIATVRRDQTTTVDFVLGTLADDPPIAASFALIVDPGPTPVTLAGVDPTNDPLTFVVTGAPTNGTLTGTPPNLVYTSNDGFVGVDTITYVADDGPNISEPGVITITVRGENLDPVARITTLSPIAAEGTRVDLSAATSSDPDGTITLYEWDLDGDGAYDDDTGVNSDVRRFDDAVATVGLRVTDDRSGVGTTTFDVTFDNVAPTLGLDEPFVLVRSIELYGDIDDPGAADIFTGTIDLGDGSGERLLSDSELDGDSIFVEHTYGSGGVFTIVVEVCDDDGDCDSATTTVTIEGPGNAAPIANITGSTSATEGATLVLSAATSTDSDGTIASYAWDLDGDGQYDDQTGASASLTRNDDDLIDVGLRVVDDVGAVGTRRLGVTFTNVDPVIVPMAEASIVAGTGVDVDGSFADPGADAWTATVDWDNGDGPQPLELDGQAFTLSRTFPEVGTFDVEVEVCDDDEGCATSRFVVTVTAANRPPVAVIDAPASTPEGSAATLDGSRSTDPDGAVVAYAWDLDGDGGYDDLVGPSARLASLSCNDDATLTVGLRVTDDDGSTATASDVVTCVNVTPTVASIAGAALEPGDAFVRSGSFDDPGTDTWTATVDWGDGAGPQALVLSGSGFELDHVYADAGTFTVAVVVCDDDESCGSASASVSVASAPPDPKVDVSITKSHDGDAVAGEAFAYTIAIANAGPDVATDVVVIDTLPAGMTFVGTVSSGWSCNGDTTVTCSLSGGLAVGAGVELVLDVTVSAEAELGDVVNTASVSTATSDTNGDDNSDSDPTSIVAPPPPASDLGASVIVVPTEPKPGDAVTMTITVTNAGPDDSGRVIAAIDVPDGLTFVGVVGPQGLRIRQALAGWTCTPGTPLACESPGIASGGNSSLVLRFLVGDAATGSLGTTITVTGESDDPDPSDNTAVAALSVVQQQPTTSTATTSTTASTTPSTVAPTTVTSTTVASTTAGTTTIPGGDAVGVPGRTGPPASPTVPPGGGLPATGTDSSRSVTVALQLLIAGVVLIALARRRTRAR